MSGLTKCSLVAAVTMLATFSIVASAQEVAQSPANELANEPEKPARKILYYSFSQGFEHNPVKLADDGGPSPSDRALIEIGKAYNVNVVCTKDGGVFDGDLSPYAAFVFYATGDLLKEGKEQNSEKKHQENSQKNHSRPMTRSGFDNLVAEIRSGKGLIGFHAATDARIGDDTDDIANNPYTQLIGARFIIHGKQQNATMKVVAQGFPSLDSCGGSFVYFDEWYSINHFNPDIRVILVQETAGMEGKEYARPPYPASWIRREENGRVGYCSMGHNDSFFQEPKTQKIIWEFLSWGIGDREIDTTPNLKEVTPNAEENGKI